MGRKGTDTEETGCCLPQHRRQQHGSTRRRPSHCRRGQACINDRHVNTQQLIVYSTTAREGADPEETGCCLPQHRGQQHSSTRRRPSHCAVVAGEHISSTSGVGSMVSKVESPLLSTQTHTSLLSNFSAQRTAVVVSVKNHASRARAKSRARMRSEEERNKMSDAFGAQKIQQQKKQQTEPRREIQNQICTR